MKVSWQGVSVRLGGREVLTEVTCDVPSGAVVGVLGANGSGKSTLLRTLYRSVVPAAGRVLLDDTDVRSLPLRESARRVAVMLQDSPSEFDLTVEETVLLGRAPHRRSFGREGEEDRRIAMEAMHQAHIADLADRMVSHLSGGQRQRVMLARALAQRTPVLVLDEPSNHLDIAHQHDLMATVRARNCTVIAALHDLTLAAQYCDHVIVMAQGRIVSSGAPAEVLTRSLVRDTFGVDSRVFDDEGSPVFAFRRLTSPTVTRQERTLTL